MSLLNEALRKNKSENAQKIVFDFPSQDIKRPERKILTVVILFAVLISGFVFAWVNIKTGSGEAGILTPQTGRNSNIKEEVQAPVHMVSEPVIHVKTGKEEKGDTVMERQKIRVNRSIENPEQADIPLITRVPDAKELKEKERMTPYVSGTEEIAVDDGAGYFSKAVLFHKQGKMENAITMYKKALSYAPENPDALFNLASIYIKLSRYSEACNILLKLLSGNPADSMTALNIAIAEIGLGKNRDAISHLEKINGEERELQFRVAFHKGVALSRIGEQPEALDSYRNAELINPGNTALLLNMAVLYDRLGRYDEAINYYLKLINSESLDSHEKEKYKQRVETLHKNVTDTPVKNTTDAAYERHRG